jgi:hypothetical protein
MTRQFLLIGPAAIRRHGFGRSKNSTQRFPLDNRPEGEK